MKRKIGIILIIISIPLIIFGLSYDILFNNGKTNNNTSDEKSNIIVDENIGSNGKEVVDNLKNVFLNKNSKKEDIEKITQTSILPNDKILGEDSILKYKDTFNTNEDLSKYDETILKYANKVEDLYLENTTFNVSEDSNNNVLVKIKPWNYYQYRNDMVSVIMKLLRYTDFNIGTDIGNEDFLIAEYKIKAIALKILDKHLDDYKSGNEVEQTIVYKNSGVDGHSYYELYTSMGGTELDNGRDKLLDKYVSEAIKDGLVDEKDPTKLIN